MIKMMINVVTTVPLARRCHRKSCSSILDTSPLKFTCLSVQYYVTFDVFWVTESNQFAKKDVRG